MSPLERPVPPVGDEIHLPGPSLQPFLLSIFITMVLLGLTIHWFLLVAGGIGAVVTIARWIMDTRREIAELPVEHGSDHH